MESIFVIFGGSLHAIPSECKIQRISVIVFLEMVRDEAVLVIVLLGLPLGLIIWLVYAIKSLFTKIKTFVFSDS